MRNPGNPGNRKRGRDKSVNCKYKQVKKEKNSGHLITTNLLVREIEGKVIEGDFFCFTIHHDV